MREGQPGRFINYDPAKGASECATARDAGNVAIHLAEQGRALKEMGDRVDALFERLDPILTRESPGELKAPSNPLPILCPVAEDVRAHNGMLTVYLSRLSELLHRIDL